MTRKSETSRRGIAAQRRAVLEKLEAKGWVQRQVACRRLGIHHLTLRSWALKGYIRQMHASGWALIQWPSVCAHVWGANPDLAMALDLPRSELCVVCREPCSLGSETCRSCEVLTFREPTLANRSR